MFNVVKKLRDLLEPSERRRALVLLAMTLVLGLMEMASVGSVLPFVAVLADPGIVEKNRYLAQIYGWLDFSTPRQFLFFLGVVVFVFVLTVTAFKALASWMNMRFVRRQSYLLSHRLLENYLQQPYEWFLGKHSSDLGRTVLGEVHSVVGGCLTPALRLATQTVVAACLIGLLVVVDPLLAVVVATLFAGAYGLVLWLSNHYVDRIGVGRLQSNRERFRASAEALGAIKDIKVLGLERTFLRRFDKPSQRMVRHAANSQIIAQMPQYAIQVITLSAVMLIVLYQLHVHETLSQALPVLALYAMAGQRLQPAFHNAYVSVTSLRFNKPALDHLYEDLVKDRPPVAAGAAGPRLAFQDRIELRNITYSYPGASTPALRNVNLTIPAQRNVGLVGHTGSGKTTAVDLLLGLLEPKQGELLVDGVPVTHENRRAWLNNLGYVSQQIVLTDDTIAANIAFGVSGDRIDMEAVERAARIGNLHTFVMEELKDGYETKVGDRGVRLSGGQRQRIGIARALYRDPDIVIMDEATSALDNVTERAVIDAVHNLANKKTVVMIAHRLTTVQRCDIIFVLEKGRVVASGTYDELASDSDSFRTMLESVATAAK